MNLSLLCVSAGEPYADRFVSGMRSLADELEAEFVLFDGAGAGAIEYVLERALDSCTRDYVLRLDDDEDVSPSLREWLRQSAFLEAPHWSFPRAHLYPDAERFVVSAPLWPDLQTRLSVRGMAGGRRGLHAGSPFGAGTIAPYPIEHHKFVVRTRAERVGLLEHYEGMQAGAGSGFRVFSVPEEFDDTLELSIYAPAVYV